jgi:hypothetical protein
LVRGNADRELVALARGEHISADEISQWAAAQLGPDQSAAVSRTAASVVLDIDEFGPAWSSVGTPRRDDTRLDRWAEVFADLPAEYRTVVCGHTHMPFVRLVDRRLVVNSGSIGMPYGRPGASWALLRDGQVSLRHTDIDVDRAIASVIASSGYPDRAEWAEYFLHARASDAEALSAFAPRDGRAQPAPS